MGEKEAGGRGQRQVVNTRIQITCHLLLSTSASLQQDPFLLVMKIPYGDSLKEDQVGNRVLLRPILPLRKVSIRLGFITFRGPIELVKQKPRLEKPIFSIHT